MKNTNAILITIVALAIGIFVGYKIPREVDQKETNVQASEKAPTKIKNIKATGIGGIFFKCKDPKALKVWYEKHLGLKTDAYGTNFEWRQGTDSSKKGFTQWSPFIETTNYLGPTKPFMINYRVGYLTALLAELATDSILPVDKVMEAEYGKFVHIMDLEGNKVELWEPIDDEYDKIVEGRTK